MAQGTDDRDPHARPRAPEGHVTENPEVHHEQTDVNLRAVAGFGVVLVVGAIVIHVVIWLLFEVLAARRAAADPPLPPLALPAGRLPPEPRLQITPMTDMEMLRRIEEQRLQGYDWMDREAGTVRIPIDRAVDLLLERGLPARPAEEAPALPEGWRFGGSSSGRTTAGGPPR
jgi:hypothetical protein